MTDRPAINSFEQRLAAEFERYVAGAMDATPAAEIADRAMRPAGLSARVRKPGRSRKLLLFGLAAALLVPAAYIGSQILRPPVDNSVPPPNLPQPSGLETASGPGGDAAIFLRRTTGTDPGLDVYLVRPDGGELLLRHLPDSIAPDGGALLDRGSVSESGWLALEVSGLDQRWPMILVDLRDPQSEPWLIEEASLGGISPAWGPDGRIAAVLRDRSRMLIIADPETRITTEMSLRARGLVGGGPSIIWTADGTGIIGENGDGTFSTVPVDGSDPFPGVGEIYGRRDGYGNGLTTLTICGPDASCAGIGDGRIELSDAVSWITIWHGDAGDRALSVGFGADDGEYWLTRERNSGRQIEIAHLVGEEELSVAVMNRATSWGYISSAVASPDADSALVSVDLGREGPASVMLPLDGGSPTLHRGSSAGFVDDASLGDVAVGLYAELPHGMPVNQRQPFPLRPINQLIEDELALNPGREVRGQAWHDADEGSTDYVEEEVPFDPGANDFYLDCFGPSSATVTSGRATVTSPCYGLGSYIGQIDSDDPVLVRATGDTSWRLVIYGNPEPGPGSSPAPVAEPAI